MRTYTLYRLIVWCSYFSFIFINHLVFKYFFNLLLSLPHTFNSISKPFQKWTLYTGTHLCYTFALGFVFENTQFPLSSYWHSLTWNNLWIQSGFVHQWCYFLIHNLKEWCNICDEFKLRVPIVLFNIAMLCDILVLVWLTCGFQHNLWSMTTPQNVFSCTLSISILHCKTSQPHSGMSTYYFSLTLRALRSWD